MEFREFSELVRERVNVLNQHDLFVVDVSKDEVYDLYQDSFPKGTNEIYLERREHDCNTCKGFIRRMGNVVAIIDGKIETIWDVEASDEYSIVADRLNEFIKSKNIVGILNIDSQKVGAKNTIQLLDSGLTKTWNHFNCIIPTKFVNVSGDTRSNAVTTTQLLARSIEEISIESIDIAIDLVEQGSLYRGDEHLENLKKFKRLLVGGINAENLNLYLWSNYNNMISRFKNTVMGTLLEDISSGMDLEAAVSSYEKKVAPENYKRPLGLYTKAMAKDAMKTIKSLGIESSLKRRHAKISDISVNDVLFSDKSVSGAMKGELDTLEDILLSEVKSQKKDLSGVTEIKIDDFIKDVLPKIDSMKILFENSHIKNLVNIIAPEVEDSPNIFKWDNAFSWVYNGGVADAIKEKVKTAGGETNAFMRTSLSWKNYDDLDIHVIEPDGNTIYYSNKNSYNTGGKLDIDMNAGHGETRDPVENITWPSKGKLGTGIYKVQVHNFTKRENVDSGFTVQVDIGGRVVNLTSEKSPNNDKTIDVCSIVINKFGEIDLVVAKDIEADSMSTDVWNIKTKEFIKVDTMMLSPNYWGDSSVGNKHYMFMLADCKNPDDVRGFFNEQLNSSLDKHRKVFEILAQKTKCVPTNEQLVGLGFSSTKRDEVIVRVSGSFNRDLKIKF